MTGVVFMAGFVDNLGRICSAGFWGMRWGDKIEVCS